jgi:pyruvate dehydrogenase E2 component (dihydrolipoamide acetyltransferase)
MPVEVVLPKVDMDMESGVIAAWKVSEGDRVQAGDVLFEMETSKSIMEVEAPASGIVRGLARVDGAALAVGTPVAWIDDGAGAPVARATAAAEAVSHVAHVAAPRTAHRAAASASQPTAARAPRTKRDATAAETAAGGETGIRATPLARRTARDAGVDLARVRGSGPRGRIVEADVSSAASAASDTTLVPFSLTRRTAARRLAESVRTAPHFYLTAHVEMTALRAALSARGREIQRAAGHAPTLTVALAFIAARALMAHPRVNASVEGDAARMHPHADIGIAMERDGDLVVPVLRAADTKTLAELTTEFVRLRDGVRAHTVTPGELTGGTFTLSNLGMHGVDAFTAIINPPQSAILAIGRVVDTPVGRDGSIVLRPMATLSLSSDHRIVDGVTAARFMADLRRSIEHPALE